MSINNEARKMRADMMIAVCLVPLVFVMFVVLAIVFGRGELVDTAAAATIPAQQVDDISTPTGRAVRCVHFGAVTS